MMKLTLLLHFENIAFSQFQDVIVLFPRVSSVISALHRRADCSSLPDSMLSDIMLIA